MRLLILFLFCLPAYGDYKTYGVGNDTCEQFLINWDRGKRDVYISFISGYMTKMNRYVLEKEVLNVTPRVMGFYMNKVCRKRQEQIFEEVLDLTIDAISNGEIELG